MPWTERPQRLPLFIAAMAVLSSILLSGAGTEKHLSVYSVVANYSLPLVERNGHDYIGLLEVLEPLGRVTARSDGPRWRLRYNNVEGDFQAGKTHARVQGRDYDLGGKFFLENGRGITPLSALSFLLRFCKFAEVRKQRDSPLTRFLYALPELEQSIQPSRNADETAIGNCVRRARQEIGNT